MFDMRTHLVQTELNEITRLISHLQNGDFDCFRVMDTEQLTARLFTEPYFDFDNPARNTTQMEQALVDQFDVYLSEKLQEFLDRGFIGDGQDRFDDEAVDLLREVGLEIVSKGDRVGLKTSAGIYPF